MGYYKTVGAVTRAIAHVLRTELKRQSMLGDVSVSIGSPGSASTKDRATRTKSINLFLYHVRPTPSLRNRTLPIYEQQRLVNVPEIGLDLYYLLSFHGVKQNDVEAENLLGLAVSALNAHPILDQRDFADSSEPGEQPSGIVDSVALTPMSLTIEEMQRLWQMFPGTSYSLSISYCASSALLVSDAVPQPPLPTSPSQPGSPPAKVGAGAPITLDSVRAAEDPQQPIVYGSAIVIAGQNLASSRVALQIAGERFAVPAEQVSPRALSFTLSAATLTAGQPELQVLHLGAKGSLASARVLSSSPPTSLTLHPKLTRAQLRYAERDAKGQLEGKLSLRIAPAPRPGQRVGVLLNGLGNTKAYAFTTQVDSEGASSLEFAFHGVSGGDYLVRYEVDGVSSILEHKKTKKPRSPARPQPFAKPKLTIKEKPRDV